MSSSVSSQSESLCGSTISAEQPEKESQLPVVVVDGENLLQGDQQTEWKARHRSNTTTTTTNIFDKIRNVMEFI